jgi:hypothetical protein
MESSTSTTAGTSAGWYPHPEQTGVSRFWNGSDWTEEREDLSAQAASPAAFAASQKRKWVMPTVGVAAALVVAGVIATGAMSSSFDEPEPASPANVAPSRAGTGEIVDEPAAQAVDLTASAGDMVQEFLDDEAAASTKYDGAWVEVDGVVNKIGAEVSEEETDVVQLGADAWDSPTVNCHGMPESALAELARGDEVTVVGQFSEGGNSGVEITSCRLI